VTKVMITIYGTNDIEEKIRPEAMEASITTVLRIKKLFFCKTKKNANTHSNTHFLTYSL